MELLKADTDMGGESPMLGFAMGATGRSRHRFRRG